MKKFIILLAAYLSIVGLASGYVDIRTRLYVTTKNGYSLDKLIFGLDSKASSSLDTALGEREIPPIPPPEGVHGGFMIFDTNQNSNIYTFVDLRPYPSDNFTADTFFLRLWKGSGDLITFNWNPLWPEILSAKIVDALTGGSIININMKDSTKALIDNEFIENFLVVVSYDPQTSVSDNNDNSQIIISPQPVNDKINIISDVNITSYRILNLTVNIVQSGNISSGLERIDAGMLLQGIYFIELSDDLGNSYIRKFVKTR